MTAPDTNPEVPPATPPAAPPAAPPATPPAAEPPAQPQTPPAEPHPNDPHKYRRLFEKADTDLQAARTELQTKTTALTEAEQKAATAEADALKLKVALKTGLSEDALEFLNATDEAGLLAQAEKLGGLIKPGQSAPPPPAGTTTQPPRDQAPSLDEQITAAQRAGNHAEAIRLKRQAAGLGPSGAA